LTKAFGHARALAALPKLKQIALKEQHCRQRRGEVNNFGRHFCSFNAGHQIA
jgi:hypothetical protein